MSDAATAPAAPEETPETALQSAVWLAQELGIALPPIPDVHAGALEEVALGQVYATDPALADLDSRPALTAALQKGWPASGLAFGYIPRGRGGRWFYTLVGDRQIIHVSMALAYDPAGGASPAVGSLDRANRRLEEYLGDEANYVRAVLAGAHGGDERRRVIAYSNEDYVPVETHATWKPGPEPLAFLPREEVFADRSLPADDLGSLVIRV